MPNGEASLSGYLGRNIVKAFRALFLWNPEKVCFLNPQQILDLPLQLERKVKNDVKYFVRSHLGANADLLVTTDKPLFEVLRGWWIEC